MTKLLILRNKEHPIVVPNDVYFPYQNSFYSWTNLKNVFCFSPEDGFYRNCSRTESWIFKYGINKKRKRSRGEEKEEGEEEKNKKEENETLQFVPRI